MAKHTLKNCIKKIHDWLETMITLPSTKAEDKCKALADLGRTALSAAESCDTGFIPYPSFMHDIESGTPVVIKGETEIESRTVSTPWRMSSGAWVVKVEGQGTHPLVSVFVRPRGAEKVKNIVNDDLADMLLLRLSQTGKMYEVLFDANLKTRQRVKDSKLTEQRMTDAALLLRKIGEKADDIRKECEATVRLLSDASCAVWTAKSMADPEHKHSIHGSIGLGTPDMKMVTTLPKKDSPEYKQMLQALGLPDDMMRDDAIRIHWPGLCDYLMELQRQGKPLPQGIDPAKTFPRYTLALRVKSGVHLDDLLEEVKAR